MATILVVDDEAPIRKAVTRLCRDRGHEPIEAASAEQALAVIDGRQIDVALVDHQLPGMSGLELLRTLADRDPSIDVVMMTSFASVRAAVDAMRAGAFDYLAKPFDNDELLIIVGRALELRRLNEEVRALRAELHARYEFPDIIGASPAMQETFRLMSKVAAHEATVLILGESGTGKELVARAIHRQSARRDGPFVAVNCSAVPDTLIEAEFFGHERGAFTDARESRAGKFEQAHGGTLFLDEVGDLSLDAQAKLLRAIEHREVTRLGGRLPRAVDVRVLAATNRDLEAAAATGSFRSDLFYRLNVLSFALPPLRERGSDLALLIEHLLGRISAELGGRPLTVSGEARRLLAAYHWPGNVRELGNTLRRAAILAETDVITARDLPARVAGVDGRGDQGGDQAEPLTLAAATTRAIERVERALIQAALAEHGGSRTATAEALGINRKTLFNKMRAYGLADGEDEG